NHGPDAGIRRKKGCAQIEDGGGQHGWTIDWNQESGIASAIEHVAQGDLDGTELAALGSGIDDGKRAVGIRNGFEFGNVFARNHDDHVSLLLQKVDRKSV